MSKHYILPIACGPGLYGAECQQECGNSHDLTQCSHTNGSCLTGCEGSYHGETCKTREWKCNLFKKKEQINNSYLF